MAHPQLTLAEINHLSQAAFVEALRGLFEGPPWLVTAAWSQRPFTSLAHFQQVLGSLLEQAPRAQQVALLKAHPDLVGRAALAGTLPPASAGEQAAAGLDRLSPADIALFQDYNRAYHERFGFPFVICARENKKESILAAFPVRLAHGENEEVRLALSEVMKICALRLRDLVSETPASRA